MVLNDLFKVCIAYNYTESIAKTDYKNKFRFKFHFYEYSNNGTCIVEIFQLDSKWYRNNLRIHFFLEKQAHKDIQYTYVYSLRGLFAIVIESFEQAKKSLLIWTSSDSVNNFRKYIKIEHFILLMYMYFTTSNQCV